MINLETTMTNCSVLKCCTLLDIDIINNSARQKIEEDLSVLDRQIRLQMGEDIKDEAESLAEAYLATPMVSLRDTLILIHSLNFFLF